MDMTFEIDAETAALIEQLAHRRGMSAAEYAGDALRRAVKDEVAFAAFLKEGEDDFARGDVLGHEEFVAELRTEFRHKDAA